MLIKSLCPFSSLEAKGEARNPSLCKANSGGSALQLAQVSLFPAVGLIPQDSRNDDKTLFHIFSETLPGKTG